MRNNTPDRSLTNCKGYTLLEALIALSLLLFLIVPLIGRMLDSIKINKGTNAVIASCLLEQEAAVIRSFPQEAVSTKRRQINGREWEIRAKLTGEIYTECTLEAFNGKTKIEKVIFYVYRKK